MMGAVLFGTAHMRMSHRYREVSAVACAGCIGVLGTSEPALADVVSITLNASSVFGTDTVVGTATLDGNPFQRQRTVVLTSSNPSVASVPASVVTSFRTNDAHFTVTTFPVAASTNVTITATEGGVSRHAAITVLPPALTSVTFSPDPVRGGNNATATITINRPAPANNWLCSIQGPLPPVYFLTGSIISFTPGATSTTKVVNTQGVSDPVNALITIRPPAGQSPNVSSILHVVPMQVASLTIVPSSLSTNAASLGCVTINGPALFGGATVSLSSDDAAVVSVPPSVLVPQGDEDGCFLVQSHAVDGCASAVISATLGGATLEATLEVGPTEQVTDNATNDRWNTRHSSTVGGNVLWTDGNDVLFDDGVSTQVVQARGGLEEVNPDMLGLGTGTNEGDVIGVWRRGTDFAWVWRNGHAPVLVSAVNPIDPNQTLNPQVMAIADGSIFMVMQAVFNDNAVKHVFQVDPISGVAINLTGDLAVPGVSRVATSGGQAAWLFVDSANPKLQFFDGASVWDIDSGEISETRIRLVRGRVVYEKVVDGVSHVFLYDSTFEDAAQVRLSVDTDASRGNFAPATDGYHVAWLSGAADGTNLDVVLYGGLQFNDAAHRPAPIAFVEFPLQLQRGQLLWKDLLGQLSYARAGTIDGICVTPATTFTAPWLADGFVAGYGPQEGTPQPDNEVFIYPGIAPSDDDLPMPPLLLRATPRRDSVILEWDQILGADEYNIYLAELGGVSKSNFSSLPGGRSLGSLSLNAARACGLSAGISNYFVVTAIENSDEGRDSIELEATSDPEWVASLGDASQALDCLAGPGREVESTGCRAFDFAASDFDCDRDVDLADYAILTNLLAP